MAGMSEEEIDATFMFRYLLVFTAALESFAHGGVMVHARMHEFPLSMLSRACIRI